MFAILQNLYLREIFLFFPEFIAEFFRHMRDDFDQKYGVDTNAYLSKHLLGVEERKAKLAEMYWPTRERPFHAIMRTLKIDHKNFTYVDLGSGKGRTLFIAASYHFKKLIGVDFSRGLHEIAEKNKTLFCQKSGMPLNLFEFKSQDATEFVFPDGPIIVFMFDPFGAEIMLKVAKNILESVKKNPREFYVAYYFPVNKFIFRNLGFKLVTEQKRNWRLDYPWVIYKA